MSDHKTKTKGRRTQNEEKFWCSRCVDVERVGRTSVFVVVNQRRHDYCKYLQVRHPRLCTETNYTPITTTIKLKT